MYKELTKTIIKNGKEMAACASYQTSECPANDNNRGCIGCSKLGAMISQLRVFEAVIKSDK